STLQGATEYGNLVIFGPAPFRQKVVDALNLLKERTPDAIAILEKYIFGIALSKGSGVILSSKPCAIYYGRQSEHLPVIEVAGALAHEGFHCKLYWEYRDSHGGQQPPKEVFSGRTGEEQCVRYQCDVLRRLGASSDVLAHYEKVLETEYWKTPFEHR